MRDFKKEFICKTILGQKTDLRNPADVILSCLSCAYDDMNTAGRFFSQERRKASFLKTYLETLRKHDFSFSRQLIEEVQILFGEADSIPGKKTYASRYGLSQKLVNMTFKYFYVFDELTGLQIDFSNCDCPLDSIVLGKLGWKKCVWSKMTREDYLVCQKQIGNLLEQDAAYADKNSGIGNLSFDFYCW